MHTPTQEQWATVIEKLYSVLPFELQEGAGLSMFEPRVNQSYTCGTIHCVGGWYAIATWQDDAISGRKDLCFVDGAHAMATDMGFANESEFIDWAYVNRDIWGNSAGGCIFSDPRAYDHGNGPAKDLADVIRHFEFVADNCKKFKP